MVQSAETGRWSLLVKRGGDERHGVPIRQVVGPISRGTDVLALVDAVLPGNGAKEVRAVGGLSGAEEEVAARVQGVVEQVGNVGLNVSLEVDEKVTGADQVEPRERRVEEHVVGSEQHALPKFRLDPVSVPVLGEEAGEPLRADVVGDGFVKVAFATPGDGVLGDVAG